MVTGGEVMLTGRGDVMVTVGELMLICVEVMSDLW